MRVPLDQDYQYEYREATRSNLPTISESSTRQGTVSRTTDDNYTFKVDATTETLSCATPRSDNRAQASTTSSGPSGNTSTHSTAVTLRPRAGSVERRIYTRDPTTTAEILDPSKHF
jgi:hypothetical protein